MVYLKLNSIPGAKLDGLSPANRGRALSIYVHDAVVEFQLYVYWS